MVNAINNNQTITTNQPKYYTSVKNASSVCIKNFIQYSRIFSLAIIAILTIIFANTDTVKAANGCSKVPDNPLGFHFKDICNKHDVRYGTPWNTIRGYSYRTWKEFADKEFYENMKNRCRNYPTRYAKCLNIARMYYEGVYYWGNNAYEDAQRKNKGKPNAQYPNMIRHNGVYWTQYQGRWYYLQNNRWYKYGR